VTLEPAVAGVAGAALAAVAGGLHRLLVRRGESVGGLELRVSIPVGDADPADRLVRIAAITRAAVGGEVVVVPPGGTREFPLPVPSGRAEGPVRSRPFGP
jgi:hypothetical protein